MKDGKGVHNEFVPGTYRPLQNKDNDYLIDRAAQSAATPTPASRASPCRTRRCRRAWGRSSTGPRSASCPPTAASSWPAQARRAVEALHDEGVSPAGVDVAHQTVRSAAVVLPKDIRSSRVRRRAAGAPGREARVGVSSPARGGRAGPHCSPAAPAPPPPLRRGTDQLHRLHPSRLAGDHAGRAAEPPSSGRWARRPWGDGPFLVFESTLPGDALLRHVAGGTALLRAELDGADTVVMVATAGRRRRRRRSSAMTPPRGIMSAGWCCRCCPVVATRSTRSCPRCGPTRWCWSCSGRRGRPGGTVRSAGVRRLVNENVTVGALRR